MEGGLKEGRAEGEKILALEVTPRQKRERDQKPSIDCLPRENKGRKGSDGKEERAEEEGQGGQKSERSGTNRPAA